jgi:hypothetical protein
VAGAALVALTGAQTAPASQAATCPARPTVLPIAKATQGLPYQGTVGEVNCLPANETLSTVTIDWGDGTSSPATATHFELDPISGAKTALIDGQHTYQTLSCPSGLPSPGVVCPNMFRPVVTAVTASDGATITTTGYGITVYAPPLPRVTSLAVRGSTVSFRVSAAARLTVRVTRAVRSHSSNKVRWTKVASKTLRSTGAQRLSTTLRSLPSGRLRVSVTPQALTGPSGPAVTRTVTRR